MMAQFKREYIYERLIYIGLYCPIIKYNAAHSYFN